MKYAIGYTRSFRHYDTIDEVIFNYSKGTDIVTRIPQIIKNQNQRVVIDITMIQKEQIDQAISDLNMFKQIHSNMAVLIDFFDQKDLIFILKENELPFFFSTFVKTYDMAYAMVAMGATDLYIVAEMGFDLKNLQVFRKQGVKLRVFPDIAQCGVGCGQWIPPVTKFWIRPEDLELYSQYVDIIEFVNRNDKLSVIYEIYKQGQWLGEIKDIVSDFKIKLENTAIAPYFGQSRISCQKKCILGQCDLCIRVQELADKFDQADVQLIRQRKKFDISQEEKEKLIKILQEKGKEINESETIEEIMLSGNRQPEEIPS